MEECSGLKSHFYYSLRLEEHCKKKEEEEEDEEEKKEEGKCNQFTIKRRAEKCHHYITITKAQQLCISTLDLHKNGPISCKTDGARGSALHC